MEKEGNFRLAVLISGSGTNLQALMDRSMEGRLGAEIAVVVSDRPQAYGLTRAERAGIPNHVVDYRAHMRSGEGSLDVGGSVDLEALDRRQRILKHGDPGTRMDRLAWLVRAEQELIGVLDRYSPDLICLAGYMRLVTPFFLDHYNREGHYRVLNIHPALLPAFPGRHGYEDTFAYGCRWGGVTVHFVDEGEDSGPVIAQAVYPIWPQDEIESIRRRGLQLEYIIYAQCITWLARGQVEFRSRPGKRPHVMITDPSYRVIIGSWVQEAFSN